jgi:hypothetical protein
MTQLLDLLHGLRFNQHLAQAPSLRLLSHLWPEEVSGAEVKCRLMLVSSHCGKHLEHVAGAISKAHELLARQH